MQRPIIAKIGITMAVVLFLVPFFNSATPPTIESFPAPRASVAEAQEGTTVGKWRRWVLELPNSSYSGNPFELEVDATFQHEGSNTEITLPGYYAGNDTWEVGFMPTESGEWSYTTTSADPELNGVIGTVTATGSGLPGMLKADPNNPRKWKFTDGGYVVPIQFRMEFFFERGSQQEFEAAADFLKDGVNGQMFDTRLTDQDRWYNDRWDYIFEGNWQDHQFDLENWERFEQRMEALTSRGLGAHIMFYSDDRGKPQWAGRSETEELVIRYVVARTAGYPIVWYNTGIDIAEYRDGGWVDWFGNQVRSLDPYGHPVSSRYGGGSGQLTMAGQSWDSRGDRLAKVENMISYFESSDVPVSMDDAWHENSPEGERRNKNYSEHDIRRAFWKNIIAGGLGGMVRGYDGYFHIGNFQSDLDSDQFLRLINPFIQTQLGDTFGEMVPDQSVVGGDGAYALADPARTKILYFFMGTKDRYDDGNGGPYTAELSGASGTYSATWFNPRTGEESNAGTFNGGSSHTIDAPDRDDWVLLMENGDGSPPESTPTPDGDGSAPTPTPTPDGDGSAPTPTPTPDDDSRTPACGKMVRKTRTHCHYLPVTIG